MSCRFGLAQSDKIRAIDDLSGSLVNSAYGFSYQLAGVDGISLLLRSFLEAVSNDRKVCLKLSTDVLRGMLHPSFQYEGRALDLGSAYKQIWVSKATFGLQYLQ